MEVTFAGRVLTPPHFFFGTRTHCEHEAFDVIGPRGKVEIVDNVTIAPPVPVKPGDRIEVRGDMVHDTGRGTVVHWTHHDPAGRHPAGFIRLRGQVYA